MKISELEAGKEYSFNCDDDPVSKAEFDPSSHCVPDLWKSGDTLVFIGTAFSAGGCRIPVVQHQKTKALSRLMEAYIEPLKPATHTVNGFEVPVAIRDEPEADARYVFIDLGRKDMTCLSNWGTNPTDQVARLARGICFKTEEQAQQNAKAMLGIDPSTPIEEC